MLLEQMVHVHQEIILLERQFKFSMIGQVFSDSKIDIMNLVLISIQTLDNVLYQLRVKSFNNFLQ